MDIIVSNASGKPIYEQISSQIRDAILSGELAPGELLPSIRSLAGDLRVSVITTKRAYNDLEATGFINSVQGKGSFVTGGSLEMQRESALRSMEDRIAQLVDDARTVGVSVPELHEMIDLVADERPEGSR